MSDKSADSGQHALRERLKTLVEGISKTLEAGEYVDSAVTDTLVSTLQQYKERTGGNDMLHALLNPDADSAQASMVHEEGAEAEDVEPVDYAAFFQYDRSVIATVDAFSQRCLDLVEICKDGTQFSWSHAFHCSKQALEAEGLIRVDAEANPDTEAEQERPPTGMASRANSRAAATRASNAGTYFLPRFPPAVNVKRSLVEVERSYRRLFDSLANVDYHILDVKVTRWHEDLSRYRRTIKDLDVFLENVIRSAFELSNSIQERVLLLESFSHIGVRRTIRQVNICLSLSIYIYLQTVRNALFGPPVNKRVLTAAKGYLTVPPARPFKSRVWQITLGSSAACTLLVLVLTLVTTKWWLVLLVPALLFLFALLLVALNIHRSVRPSEYPPCVPTNQDLRDFTRTSPLIQIGQDIWVKQNQLSFMETEFGCKMTVIRDGDSLVVISPVEIDPEVIQQIDELGTVRAVYSPSPIHTLFIQSAADAWPSADIFVPEIIFRRSDITLPERAIPM
ncbi:dynein heavy chain [Kipferlia bialata]|uniref:Dynein heavy chain n=1 Tax=Kipferlia bialata TaxID=797122 RepID=A0A9K3GJA5_9EUKA|nr:dynein heavy chain [Kipferlia bialata]|eukprot:g5742.t1